MAIALLVLSLVATVAVLAWVYVLLDTARPWDFRLVAEDFPEPQLPDGTAFPPVRIVVPARNEAESLPKTLPALLQQDCPGPIHVVLVDDRSDDNTAASATEIADKLGKSSLLTVLKGAALPDGWTGKVWALDQGVKVALPDFNEGFVLLTDADIEHAPRSLRRLVAESLSANLALNSRMARLRCATPAERLLIPAFVFFFNLLYPMRRVNSPADPLAAAAGGCVLLSRDALARLGGGFESIRGEIIDDVNLARQVKSRGLPIRLTLSRNDVRSLREYPRIGDVWKMVRRTAFTELMYSWLRLAGALAGLSLLFVVPLLAVVGGALGIAFGELAAQTLGSWALFKGILALALMRVVYGPAVAFFETSRRYAYALPLAGILYGLMTLDSGLRHARGQGVQWRGGSSTKQ